MAPLLEILTSVDFWKFVIPLGGAVIAWFMNERQKRLAEQYREKEASYRELLRCLRGFYVGAPNAAQFKDDSLNQLNFCWLYCPDEVIAKDYAFLNTVHAKQAYPDEVKERAMGDFVAAIRHDLLSRKLVRKTRFTGANFKHLGLTAL